MITTIQFQTGVDCLGFPTITQHKIILRKYPTQNGNRYLPKTVYFTDVIQSSFIKY